MILSVVIDGMRRILTLSDGYFPLPSCNAAKGTMGNGSFGGIGNSGPPGHNGPSGHMMISESSTISAKGAMRA